MSNSVRRTGNYAFSYCTRLVFVRLSTNLEYIGYEAFCECYSLTSIFIPPSCREIDEGAFVDCSELIILGLHQLTQLGEYVFGRTEFIKKYPITDEEGEYDEEHEVAAVEWIKSINNGDAYALHRACSSFNPIPEIIHALVKRQGIEGMRMQNSIGITPSQHLEANPFANISEKEIINKYILDMMGEIV